jgi:hypothetical protein
VHKKVQVCRKVKVCVPVCEMQCAKPSLLDHCKGLFSFCGHNKGCCDSGYGAHYAYPAAPAAPPTKAELLPAPKVDAPK